MSRRERSAFLLGTIGPAARPALEELTKTARQDPDPRIRRMAAHAMPGSTSNQPFRLQLSIVSRSRNTEVAVAFLHSPVRGVFIGNDASSGSWAGAGACAP